MRANLPRRKLQAIQAARFVAALLVLLFHGERMLAVYMHDVPRIFTFGRSGVDFFFVLSGFIIYYVHSADIGRRASLGYYLWRRVTRVYPIYWVVTAGVIAAALLFGHRDIVESPLHLLSSFLLIPETHRLPVVAVAWTLSHEMLFYLAFGSLIFSLRAGLAVFAIWSVLMVVNLARPLPPGPLAFLADPFHFEFMAGMVAAWLTCEGRVARPFALLALGLAAFLVAGLFENAGRLNGTTAWGHLCYGGASAIIVAGLAAAESRKPRTAGEIGSTLGAWSYEMYLVHDSVIGHFAHGLAVLGVIGYLSPGFVLLLCAVVCVVVAASLHHWLERPIARFLHAFMAAWLRRPGGQPAAMVRPPSDLPDHAGR